MIFLSGHNTPDMYSLSIGIPVTITLVSLWIISRVVYRLFFHPLAKFPGPKLAASTVFFEFYYDGIRGGQYTFEIAKMHKKYGMYMMTLSYFTLYDCPAACIIMPTSLSY